MLKKNLITYILLTLFSCSTVSAGPVSWDAAEKYITIQQKQFCDLTNNHVVNLYKAINSRNEIKINRIKKQRQEDLDALLPTGKFENWIVKLVSIKQVQSPQDQNTDGDAAAVFELSCGSQIGSGSFLIDGKVSWGATIPYNDRRFRELAKLDQGQFIVGSGTMLEINAYKPGQKETFYASQQIGEHPLTKGLNLEGELFIADLSYIAALN